MPSKNKKKGGKNSASDMDADAQKNLGNVAFQAQDYEKAILHYSRAIDLDNTNPIFYSNRANVYIELEEFGKAIEDSDTAIQLNPQFTRAYFRKATALFEQPHIEGSLEASLATLETGLATVSEENKEGMPADQATPLKKLFEKVKEEIADENVVEKSNPERQRFEKLFDWMKVDGANYEKLKMRYYTLNYRGVHASRAIKKGETILYVPLKEIITLEMCMDSPIGKPMFARGFRQRLISPKHSFFSTFLMEERRKGADSYFSEYIDILPKSFEAYPIFYSPQEMEMLVNTNMVRQVDNKIADMRQDYDIICKEVPEFTQFPFQEYQQMRLLVASRIFGISVNGHKTDGFVPYADMLNHKRPRETSWTYCDQRQGFIIDAICDIERGQPVHDSYGRKSNTRFLLNYGFINRDNDANDLPLNVAIKEDDPLFVEKTKALSGGRWRSYSFMADYEEEVTFKVLSFIRYVVLTGTPVQLQQVVSGAEKEIRDRLKRQQNGVEDSDDEMETHFKGENLRAGSFDNEQAVQKYLLHMFSTHLQKYSASIEEDREILKDEKLTENERNCVLFRVGEKEICEFFIDSSTYCLEMMGMKFIAAKKKTQCLPNNLETMRDYLRSSILPLILENEQQQS